MKISIHNHASHQVAILAVFILLGVCFVPFISFAATTNTTSCTFTRDLQLGVTGDDVKCLQVYLNTHGFPIAASGVGSAGHETGEYKTLTEAAVIKWQKANKLAPAIGYFGAQSRLLFKNGSASIATTAGTATVNAPLLQVPTTSDTVDSSNPNAALIAQVMALKAILEGKATALPTTHTAATVAATVVTPVVSVASGTIATTSEFTDATARTAMSAALSQIAKAESAIKKNDEADTLDDAKDYLVDAKDLVITGLRAYLRNDFETALTTFTKVKKTAAKAVTTLDEAA